MNTHCKFLLTLVMVLVVSCNEKSEITFHKSHEASRQNVPFSDAVETGNLLFLTGQIGKNHKTGELVEGGITTETIQTIKNIEAVLKHHQLTLDHVVKCTVILSDINDFKAFNSEYVKYFKNKPARTTFAAANLAANAKIEIDVIAAK
ncbi:Rid family detoxifying hydrolase [Ichthyenterobacterium sp. W332]|uniref:Rid family detoxifying hydrolase n=1 Tax=Microcosmobacter mediterraneus TaxID=3075607 RepID=A0ABU2YNA0_9FLAO|nr:Rid family detoxifying hydrolase [Ichthyenterobacterium sp. W332]MDT0559643.1 Rid family detoxifying hydrolase [Ichthyenterobacterium sp. W332]